MKRRLSPRLLGIPGVSGVGLSAGKLTVYLAQDSDQVRQKVADMVESDTPGTLITYVVSGTFHPQHT